MLLKIADRMIFDATRDPIDPGERRRVAIPFSDGNFEAWVLSSEPAPDSSGKIFALKFPGTGGRAEQAGPHPCEIISPASYEVWTINPPGYGTSDGQASIRYLLEFCDASWQAFSHAAADHTKLIIGNSLGCLYALYVAANFKVDGLMLRNPVPLHEFILARYSWWNLGIGTRAIVRKIPHELNAIENSSRCRCPAFFTMSEQDRLIPPDFQRQIFDVYGGTQQLYSAKGIDHHEPIPEDQVEDYFDAVRNFGMKLSADHRI